MALFVIAFFIWLFATGNYGAWIALASSQVQA